MNKLPKYKIFGIAIVGAFLPCVLLVLISMMFYGSQFPIVKYYYLQASFAHKRGDLSDALHNYNEVIRRDKNYINGYISRGSLFLDQKKYKQAIDDYSHALQLQPQNEEAYAYRGRAFYEIKNNKAALEDYNLSLQINPNFAYAYTQRALLKYTQLHDFQGACEDLNRAAELGDSDAKAHLENKVCEFD